MNRPEVVKLLTIAKTYWPNASFNEGVVDGWTDLLDDVAYADALAALRICAKTGGEFRPSVATLRRTIAEQALGTTLPTPLEAWAEVRQRIEQYGLSGRTGITYVKKIIRQELSAPDRWGNREPLPDPIEHEVWEPVPITDVTLVSETAAVATDAPSTSVTFSCPEIAKAVKDIGWRALCTEPEGKMRDKFTEQYSAYRDRTLREVTLSLPAGEVRRRETMGTLPDILAALQAGRKDASDGT